MKKIIEKFISLEQEIADEKGDFVLFAIFQPDEFPPSLDVVVSAPWFGKDRMETIGFMVDKIRSKLTPEEMRMVSKVIVLYPAEHFVKEVTSDIQVEHGKAEFTYRDFNGMLMKHAYIVTSKPIAA